MMNLFLKTLGLLLLLSIHIWANKLPNVVIIYADDMGYGDLRANNLNSKIATPHLDALTAEGIRFTDGHSSSGICTPSRFALLTGQHHWRRFHDIVGSFGETVFEPDDLTIGKMFQAKGYNTACIGKWHLGWGWDALLKKDIPKTSKHTNRRPSDYDWNQPIPDGPLSQGFDYYFGDGTINFPPYCWIENDRVLNFPTKMLDTTQFKKLSEGRWESREGPMAEDWNPYQVLPTITQKAVEWINRQSEEKPFFLYFPLPSPHAPMVLNEKFKGLSEAGTYGDFVSETDSRIGTVLTALKENNFADNTIVVFTSDNGPERYAFKRDLEYGHWSSEPLRGLKRDLWEGGHRVPFVIRWPHIIEPGIISDETISQVDLLATFAEIIDYELQSHQAIDSYDLTPLLKGENYPKPLRRATVQNTKKDLFAIREGNWIYIDSSTGEHTKAPQSYEASRHHRKETTPGLLFDLKNDLEQTNNLFKQYPAKVNKMKVLLERYKSGEGCAPHFQKQ